MNFIDAELLRVPKMAAPRKETYKHLRAFELYSAYYGEPDTLKKVAELMGVTARAISYWKEIFRWEERYDIRTIKLQAGVNTALEQRAVNTVTEEIMSDPAFADDEYFKGLVAETAKKYRELLETGEVKPNSTLDLTRLVQMHRLLSGQPTGNELVFQIITAVPRPEPVMVIEGTIEQPSMQANPPAVDIAPDGTSGAIEETTVITAPVVALGDEEG